MSPVLDSIPVIAVTSIGRSPRTRMAAGFDGYQAKPLDVKTFPAAVEATLAR